MACGGLPDEDIKKAQLIPATLKQAKEIIVANKKANKTFLNSEQGKILKPYADREKWDNYFNQANLEYQQSESIYQKTVLPIIERDDDKEIIEFRLAMIQIHRKIVATRVTASKASSRKNFLLSTIKNAPDLVSKAKTDLIEINHLLTSALKYTKKPALDHPLKKEDINSRYQTLNLLRNKANKSLSLATAEFDKIKSHRSDYAIFGDNIKNITDTLAKLTKSVPALKAKFDELYRSYSKTLVDMRIDYFVQIARTSWDNSSDNPSEHTYIYTSQVAENVANYFNKRSGLLATGYKNVAISSSVDKRMWAALKILPNKSWPSTFDTTSEFWVKGILLKYYHKYLITENTTQKVTKWQMVKSNYFWANEKNLGLTLLSKPYGMYEEETIKSASPPGLEYIATPVMLNGKATGKNQYGEWKQDSSGNSFWEYYVAYSFIRMMLGGNSYHPYYYKDWTNYSSRKSGTSYYGTGQRYGTYGSSTYNNSRYKQSNYSRKNPGLRTASGRNKLRTSSKSRSSTYKHSSSGIRSSGPRSRSRGPSGGGK